jgi:hypothetical protein
MLPIAEARYVNPNQSRIETTMVRGENCNIEIGSFNVDMTNQVNLNEGYLEKRYGVYTTPTRYICIDYARPLKRSTCSVLIVLLPPP